MKKTLITLLAAAMTLSCSRKEVIEPTRSKSQNVAFFNFQKWFDRLPIQEQMKFNWIGVYNVSTFRMTSGEDSLIVDGIKYEITSHSPDWYYITYQGHLINPMYNKTTRHLTVTDYSENPPVSTAYKLIQ